MFGITSGNDISLGSPYERSTHRGNRAPIEPIERVLGSVLGQVHGPFANTDS